MKEQNLKEASCKSDLITTDNGNNQNISTRKLAFDGLFSATFFITVATALLYLIGYSYHTSYLDTWGVEADLFSLPIQQYLIYGGSVLSVGGMLGGTILLVFICTLLITAFFLNMIITRSQLSYKIKFFWNRNYRSEISQNIKIANWFKSIFIELFPSFLTMLLFVFLSYLFYFSTQWAGTIGKNVAKKNMLKLADNKIEYSQNGFSMLKRFVTEQKSFNAFVIAANDKFYALSVPVEEDQQHLTLTIPTTLIMSVTAEGKQPQINHPDGKPSSQKVH